MKERLGRKEGKVGEVGGFLDRWGIEWLVVDCDDTVANTRQHFLKNYRDYAEYVGRKAKLKCWENVYYRMLDIDREFRHEFQVRPARLYLTALTTARLYGLKEEDDGLMERVDRLMEIYKEAPEAYEGAREQLELVKGTGRKVGMLTHAGEDWTRRKLWSLGWGSVFDDYYCTPVEKSKGSEEWLAGIENFDTTPEKVMVWGNSINSDIIPAVEIGVNTVVWLDQGFKEESASLPDRAIVGGKIEGLMERVLEMERRGRL